MGRSNLTFVFPTPDILKSLWPRSLTLPLPLPPLAEIPVLYSSILILLSASFFGQTPFSWRAGQVRRKSNICLCILLLVGYAAAGYFDGRFYQWDDHIFGLYGIGEFWSGLGVVILCFLSCSFVLVFYSRSQSHYH